MNNISFFGTYQHKVDSKGRVSIPAKWRRHLNGCCFSLLDYETLQHTFYIHINDVEKESLQYFSKHNLDQEGRMIFKQERGKTAIMKGYGNYFIIEFGLDN